MKTVKINGKVREAIGKKDSKKLRSEKKVPCVLYGGDAPIHFYALEGEFRKIIHTPSVFLIDLDIDGTVYTAIMQDVQFHPVTDGILHIDFLLITEEKKVKLEIPVEVEGFAAGIRSGGKLSVEQRRLKVIGLAKDLPDVININVTDLELNESIRVGDLELENLEFLTPKSVPVVRVMITRAARAAGTGEDGEELEEGAEGAEGTEETAEEQE